MSPGPDENAPIINTSLAKGVYYVDNVPHTVAQLCIKAYKLKPEIMRTNVNPVQVNVQGGVGYIDLLPLNPGAPSIDTREAAQVLRLAGHVVDDKPFPSL